MRRRFTKAVDARRRARKAARKTVIKTGTKVIPDKRCKPEKHKSMWYPQERGVDAIYD